MNSALSKNRNLKLTKIVYTGGNSKNYIATFKILEHLCKYYNFVTQLLLDDTYLSQPLSLTSFINDITATTKYSAIGASIYPKKEDESLDSTHYFNIYELTSNPSLVMEDVLGVNRQVSFLFFNSHYT